MAPRVLSQVEGGEVEPEHFGLGDEAAEAAVGQTRAGVPAQAGLDEAQVGEKRLRRRVDPGPGQVVGAPGPPRGLESGLQPPIDKRHLLAVELLGIV